MVSLWAEGEGLCWRVGRREAPSERRQLTAGSGERWELCPGESGQGNRAEQNG